MLHTRNCVSPRTRSFIRENIISRESNQIANFNRKTSVTAMSQTIIWVHGCNLITDQPVTTTHLDHSAGRTRMTTTNPNPGTPHIVTIAIPTPSFLFGKPMQAKRVLLKYKTNNTQINQIILQDGALSLFPSIVGPLTSNSVTVINAFVISPPYDVEGGMAMSFEISFLNPAGFFDLIGAGIEFEEACEVC